MIAVCLSCHLKPLFSSFFFIIICQCCCDGYERQTWECTSWVYILSVESSLLLSIMYHSVSKVKVTSFWLTCKCIENVFFFFWPKVNRIRGEEGTWKYFFSAFVSSLVHIACTDRQYLGFRMILYERFLTLCCLLIYILGSRLLWQLQWQRKQKQEVSTQNNTKRLQMTCIDIFVHFHFRCFQTWRRKREENNSKWISHRSWYTRRVRKCKRNKYKKE